MDSLRRANEMERRERQREAAAVALGHGEGGGWCARGPLSSFFWLRILRSLRCDRRSAQQAYLYSAAGGCYATVIVLVESGKQAGLSFASVMVLLALQVLAIILIVRALKIAFPASVGRGFALTMMVFVCLSSFLIALGMSQIEPDFGGGGGSGGEDGEVVMQDPIQKISEKIGEETGINSHHRQSGGPDRRVARRGLEELDDDPFFPSEQLSTHKHFPDFGESHSESPERPSIGTRRSVSSPSERGTDSFSSSLLPFFNYPNPFAYPKAVEHQQEFSREVLGRPWHESVLEGPRHSSLGEEGPQFTPSHARAQQNKQTLSSSNFQRRFRRGRSPSGVFNDTEGFSHWIAAGYPVCGMRYGSLVPPPDRAPERSEESNASSQGKEGGEPLSILDMALLAASAYWSDEGTINDLLNRFFRNNKTHIDFEVGMLENESLIGRAVEVFFPSQNLTVVAIRGTASKADAFADLDFWSAIAGVQMIDRFFVPLLSWLPKRFVQSALSVTLTDFSEPFSLVVERLEKFVQDVATRRGLPEEAEYTARGAQLLLVGHSLGGGLATLLGTQLSRPAVTFSAPGIYYTSSRYGISDLRMQQLVTAVVPERDPVPQVDVVRGLVQHVNCASRRAEHCHMMYMTMCELFCRCGDPREWVKNLCDGLARRYSLRWSGCVGGGSIPSSPSSSTSAPAPSATRAVAKSEAETQAVGGSKPNRQEPTVYA